MKQNTLGNFIEQLEKVVDKSKHITFEFPGVYPSTFASYRGCYQDIALGYETGYSVGNHVDVEIILKRAIECIDKSFEGWKGGTFLMDKSSTLWVSNQGECFGMCISGIEEKEYEVIIKTLVID